MRSPSAAHHLLCLIITSPDLASPPLVMVSPHLAQAVVEWQRLNAEGLHALQLLLVEILELVHRQVPVSVNVHAPVSK